MESFGFKFLQGYGLTETSPLACGNRLNDREPGTVGKAVYGEEIRIDLSEKWWWKQQYRRDNSAWW